MRRYWKLKEEHEIKLSVELVLEEAVDVSQDSLLDGNISYILELEVLHCASEITPPHRWTVATIANTESGK
jgi:hypothetical protein